MRSTSSRDKVSQHVCNGDDDIETLRPTTSRRSVKATNDDDKRQEFFHRLFWCSICLPDCLRAILIFSILPRGCQYQYQRQRQRQHLPLPSSSPQAHTHTHTHTWENCHVTNEMYFIDGPRKKAIGHVPLSN
jgi:hypothetical protein